MMGYLRGHVAKAIFGVLLFAFLGWIVIEVGAQGRFASTAGAVAFVNGERITSQEFYMLYNQELEGAYSSMRGSMTQEDEKELRKQVLERLVDQTLAWQEAKRQKLDVSAQETTSVIRSQFSDPSTGQFDAMRYQAVLGRLGISQRLFETAQQRAFSSGRIEGFVREGVRATDLELWLEYLRLHRRMKAVILPFRLAEAKAKVNVTPDEVREYWANNRGEFEKPERVRIRHIVVAASQQGGPEAAAQARAKMESVSAELKKKADFADVAKRRSDDANTSARGGDLGWMARGQLIPEYEAVAFKLGKGKVSSIFQTKFGYHLIKCEAHEAEQKPTFDEVKGKIRTKLVEARARQQLLAEALRARLVTKQEKDLKKVATQVGRRAVVTDWFDKGKTAPTGLSAKSADRLIEALLPLEPGDVTDLVETEEGFFIVQLTDELHRKAAETGFLKERAALEPLVVTRKQVTVYRAFLAALKAKAKIKVLLDAV